MPFPMDLPMQYKLNGLQDKFDQPIRSPFTTAETPVLEGEKSNLNYEPHLSYPLTTANDYPGEFPKTASKTDHNEESLHRFDYGPLALPTKTEHILASQLKIEKVDETDDPMKYAGIELFLVHKVDPDDRDKIPEPPVVEPGQEISATQYMKRRKLLEGSWYQAQI